VGKISATWQGAVMDNYERVAGVIRYLDRHHSEQPDLADLAGRLGLSRFHFHRLFSAWAGVTPKAFIESLTLAQVRDLLKRGESVLDTALESGLSGPGRVHDLCVNLVAASPGELKAGGCTWTIQAGFTPCPFGLCLIGQSPRGVCHLSFIEPGGEAASWEELRSEWPAARLRRDDATAARLIADIFQNPARPGSCRPLQAYVKGTSFQLRVWQALLRTRPGQVTTYGRLAVSLGRPSAARAVGQAVARNPLAYLIPCHRVIRETGVVGNYRWGLVRKRALLAWESAASAAQKDL
jgi:AraC family transcriptional regulator, regulatory protein of adaptative response / methylated-DNA-[protein]-cysteine methyltransferase